MPEELKFVAEVVGLAVLLLLIIILIVVIVALFDVFILKRKEPEEPEEKAIEHPERINITYDNTGNTKQLSKELRQLRKGGR